MTFAISALDSADWNIHSTICTGNIFALITHGMAFCDLVNCTLSTVLYCLLNQPPPRLLALNLHNVGIRSNDRFDL